MSKYGWIPDIPDRRDIPYRLKSIRTLPERVELTETGRMPPVYNQGDLGSCTANAIAAHIDFNRAKQKEDWFKPSRLFIYFNERAMEGTIGYDSGAYIRDGIKSVVEFGACAEDMWPYNPSNFKSKPADICYQEAMNFQVVQYQRLNNEDLMELKNCLACGFPFVFGFSVYESFETEEVARTGRAPMPKNSESLLGGHAVLCCGYNDKIKRFIVRNSWGPGWGKGGYFTLPYEYMTNSNLADDFWTIRQVE